MGFDPGIGVLMRRGKLGRTGKGPRGDEAEAGAEGASCPRSWEESGGMPLSLPKEHGSSATWIWTLWPQERGERVAAAVVSLLVCVLSSPAGTHCLQVLFSLPLLLLPLTGSLPSSLSQGDSEVVDWLAEAGLLGFFPC